MTYRALELLNLPEDEPAFLLDIGCGSGLSGEILDEEGYTWTGVDIAPSMLGACSNFSLAATDCFQRLPWSGKLTEICFCKTSDRALDSDQEVLTGLSGMHHSCRYHFLIHCISISVLQWLLNAETSHPTSSPPHRLTRFFTTLHSALRNPSRAVFQFYPSSDDQIQLITSIAQKAGFGGGVVVDYPNSNKARKVFLCLIVGGAGGQQQVPAGLDGEEVDDSKAKFEKRRVRERKTKDGKRKSIKDRDWIIKKKDVSCLVCS